MIHAALQAPVGRAASSGLTVRTQWSVLPLFLIVAALFLYWDAASVPVVLWDESRNIVNALEMRASGWSLVTTFGFEPDHWNSKPPLLIWLMTGSLALFGPVEWALRVPVMLASLGTLALTFIFARRFTGSRSVALFACAVLLLSPGFFAGHGARTADYDALLTFFTTAYLFLLFIAFSRATPRRSTVVVAGLAIAGAVLTKSSAGLLPGAGVFLYLLVTARFGRVVREPLYWVMALVAVAPVALFYVAREIAAPGYLQAVQFNEFSGRFGQTLIGREEPLWFYVRDMLRGWFVAAPLMAVAPLGWSRVRGKSRLLLIYCLCVSLGVIAVLSVASTKLPHYALPAYPPLAIAAALLLRGAYASLAERVRTPRQAMFLGVTVALCLALPTVRSLYWRIESLPASQAAPATGYGPLFANLLAQGVSEVSVMDPGIRLDGRTDYAPVLRAYQLLWAEHGLRAVRAPGGAVLASCDRPTAVRLLRLGRDIGGVPGCVAVTSERAGRS